MRTQEIHFPDQQQVLCAFPAERSELAQAVSELKLGNTQPVIVLIGGMIEKQELAASMKAIQSIAKVAEDMKALVICGGTDMGVMSEIGLMRSRNGYKFPLIGITLEDLVTWPGGPKSTKFLLWGKQLWPLAPHYTHFILVPGNQFGDESPWIVDAATILSKGHQSVTILINGGEVSRKDIDLSLENGRPVIALARTGRLADELARQPTRDKLITVIPANSDKQIVEVIQAALTARDAQSAS